MLRLPRADVVKPVNDAYDDHDLLIGPRPTTPTERESIVSPAQIGSLASARVFGVNLALGGPHHRRKKKPTPKPSPTAATNCPTCSAAALGKHPLYGPGGGPDPNDVEMGGPLGDCALMGELISIATVRPDLITGMIEPLGNGKYRVTFPTKPPRVVEVTDAVPSNPDGSPTYAGFGANGAKWPMVMQNAYAKAFFGDDYSKMQGMAPVDVLGNLSGLPISHGLPSDKTFGQFQKMMSNGGILSAGLPIHKVDPVTGKETTDAHLFSVTKFFVDADGVQQVIVTNAWGVGPAGTDPAWLSNRRTTWDWLLGNPDFKMPTGTATIPFSDFQRGFNQYTVQGGAEPPVPIPQPLPTPMPKKKP